MGEKEEDEKWRKERGKRIDRIGRRRGRRNRGWEDRGRGERGRRSRGE